MEQSEDQLHSAFVEFPLFDQMAVKDTTLSCRMLQANVNSE